MEMAEETNMARSQYEAALTTYTERCKEQVMTLIDEAWVNRTESSQ